MEFTINEFIFCSCFKGMALSGAEDEQNNNRFLADLKQSYPDLTDHYYLTSDSVGTIATALANGKNDSHIDIRL